MDCHQLARICPPQCASSPTPTVVQAHSGKEIHLAWAKVLGSRSYTRQNIFRHKRIHRLSWKSTPSWRKLDIYAKEFPAIR